MKKFIKSPIFYVNVALLVILFLLVTSIDVKSANLPNFVKTAVAQVQQAITGGGTINYLSAFGTANTIGNSIIYDNGTAVGIGTTNPGDSSNPGVKLDVVGSSSNGSQVGMYIRNTNATGATGIGFWRGGQYQGALAVTDSAGLFMTTGPNNANGLTLATSKGWAMRILDNGNTLINGLAGGSDQLDIVKPTVKDSYFATNMYSGDGFLGMNPSSGAGSWNPMVQAGDKSIIYSNGSIDTGNLFIGPWSASSKGIKINSAGVVGIGTANPGESTHPGITLDVVGNNAGDNTDSPSVGMYLRNLNASGPTGLAIWRGGVYQGALAVTDSAGLFMTTGPHNANGITFATSKGWAMQIKDNGDVSVPMGGIHATGDICTDAGGGKCLSGLTGPAPTVSTYWSASGNNIYNGNSGNVGINTSNPAAKFDVVDGQTEIATGANLFGTQGTKDLQGIYIKTNSASNTGLVVDSSVNNNKGMAVAQNGQLKISAWYAPNADRFMLSTYDANTTITMGGPNGWALNVKGNGNVGIGTDNPTQKLDVSGNVNAQGFCINGNCITSWPTAGTPTVAGITGSGTANSVPKWTSGTALGNSNIFDNGSTIYLGSAAMINGGLMIGTGSGNSDITLNSSSRPTIYPTVANVGVQLRSNGSGLLQLNGDNYNAGDTSINNGVIYVKASSGNVGIGTSNPDSSFKLDVAGNIRANALYGSDVWTPALVSNGNGHSFAFQWTGSTLKVKVDSTPMTILAGSGMWCGNGVTGGGDYGEPSGPWMKCQGYDPGVSCPPGFTRVNYSIDTRQSARDEYFWTCVTN